MNTLQSVSRTRWILNIVTIASLMGIAAPSFAGVTISTYADAPTFSIPNGAPVLQTTTTPQALDTINQQVTVNPPTTLTSLTQTIVTGESGFQLDAIDIYSGGKAGGTATLNIYPAPVGGADTDGFVNTSFSTDLLNGGAGLPFTFNGSPGLQYIRLDLNGADEITLAPNTKYAIEFDVTSGTFSWQRDVVGAYPNGNIYQGATELNFNGTPPANGRGERDQVGGTPQRDSGMALIGKTPPFATTNRTDAATWPGSPKHTTTGALNLQTDFSNAVALDPGGAVAQTFTPDTTFKLDKFMIRAAGAATTGELYLFQVPSGQGGAEGDGFVNVGFSNSILNGGLALPFTFTGTAGSLVEFDLTGNNEVTLQAGVEYAIDLRNTGSGSMFWMRDEDPYSGGNIYAQANAAADTQRFDVSGEGRKDGALALYAAGIPGDFNNDGKVDAGDYATWRKNETAKATLPNDNGAGNQAARYALWRANFGNASGAASGLSGGAVPEPGTALLALVATCLIGLSRGKK